MSSIPQNTENKNEIFDSATKFLKEFQVGKILFQCNAGKAKGIPVMDIFRYLFCLIFSDRSMYMQRKTGTFEPFPKKWTRKMRKKQNEANRSE